MERLEPLAAGATPASSLSIAFPPREPTFTSPENALEEAE